MGKFVTEIVAPDNSSKELKEAAEKTNTRMLELVNRTVGSDPGFAISRFIVLIILALVIVGSTIALIIAALNEDGWAAAASATGMIVSLSIVGLMNPLQTIERDIIIRRWSDIIISGWAADLAEAKISTGTATKRATERFAILAAAYATMTSKTTDALSALVASTEVKDEQDTTEPEALTLAPITSQTSEQGADLGEGLTIEASGGSGKYTFAATSLPKGLSIPNESVGVVKGKVADDADTKDWNVEVTVTEVLEQGATETPQAASAQFVWTVTAAGS